MNKQGKIIAFMNSYSQGKSGGDMVFVELARRLRGINLLIITSELGKKLCEGYGVKGNYVVTSKEKEFKKVIYLYLIRTLRALAIFINVGKGDIFWATSDFLPDVLPVLCLKLRYKDNRWIQHIFHIMPASRKIPYWSQKLSLHLIKNFCDRIVVDNLLLKKDLTKRGFDTNKIYLNYPGTDVEKFSKIKSEEKIFDASYMAQLRSQKGVFDLIKIWQVVINNFPKATLAIIGRGAEEVILKMEEEIKKASLENNIKILGYLPDNEAYQVIASSKIFIFPSHEEGFGIAPLEAQSLGIPVVAYNLPVYEEIFLSGMIKIKKGDINDFAQNIIKLLVNEDDRKRLSLNAKQNALRFNWDIAAEKEREILFAK